MLKLIESNLEDSSGEAQVRVLHLDDAEALVKEAADSEISEFVRQIKPSKDRVYVHILAMGAGEAYSSNRNGDFFPEEILLKYHKTFQTNPAHVFRNHINKNPDIAIGKVIFSTYNRRMRRVELVAWIDKSRGEDVIQRIEQGEFPATSMACKTPWDECSICGNRAGTRQEYCSHLSNELGRMYTDGRKVMAMNIAPISLFDISIVVRPADVTSSILQKVASTDSEDQKVISSAELAEIEGLVDVEKQAGHKKLSELIKEIEDGGFAVDVSENLDSILSKVKDPDYGIIKRLSKHDLAEVLTTMAHLGVSPSLGFLAELIGHKISGEAAEGIGDLVEGFVGTNGADKLLVSDKTFEEKDVNTAVANLLMPSIKTASLLPEMVAMRASAYAPIPGTNVGYVGNGPKVEETPIERFKRLYDDPNAKKPGGFISMIKSLIMVGGAALAAKWYITKTIESKMRNERALIAASAPPAKIVLVKSASDYTSAYHLAKSAMVKVLKQTPAT
jgi:hypothetical protein